MATTFTINTKISNPNKVKAKALITHLSDSSVDKTVEIEGGKDTTVAIQTTEYKGTLDVLFSANGFNNSESATINYEFNPLDKVQITYTGGLNTLTNMYETTIQLTNNSNYNLVLLQEGTSGTVNGTALVWNQSDNAQEIEFNRTETITPFSVVSTSSSAGSVILKLTVQWVLDGVTKTSIKEIRG